MVSVNTENGECESLSMSAASIAVAGVWLDFTAPSLLTSFTHLFYNLRLPIG